MPFLKYLILVKKNSNEKNKSKCGGTSSQSMSRVRFNTNDSTYADDTAYDIHSNVQLDLESLERWYGNINPNFDENSVEEVEVDLGEEDLEDTPTSLVTQVPNETINSMAQNVHPLYLPQERR